MASVLIDGSVLEGGGQILRNSIALSGLLSKPISVRNIRAGRKSPGLKNQHRTGLELAAEIASARLKGATNGSLDVDFTPGSNLVPGHFDADSVTAGSTTLLLQIALPLLLFSRDGGLTSTLTLKGGTNATQAPQIDYTQHVFLPFMRQQFGVTAELQVNRRGYFPKGGGEITATITPTSSSLKSFSLLERGDVRSIRGIAHLAGLPGHLGKSIVEGATKRIREALPGFANAGIPIMIENRREKKENTVGAGSGIVLWAELGGGGVIGGSAVGRKGIDSYATGVEAANELLRGLESGGCVDEWLQDQIIIFMALAKGRSEVLCGKGGLQLHTKTAVWVAEQLTEAKFSIEEIGSGHTVIRCDGIGYSANSRP